MSGSKPSSTLSSRASVRRAGPRYEAAGFFLVRAPLLPAAAFHQLVAASGDIGVAEAPAGCTPGDGKLAGLSDFLRDARVKCAVIAASPALASEAAVQASASCLAGADSRVFRSLFRYINRMSTRPTPFGLFAAVGTGRFGDSTSLRLAADPLRAASFRPDMGWLESVTHTAKDLAGADSHLRVMASSTVFERGQRLSQYRQASADQHEDGATVSIRSTAVVRDVLELASAPIALGELATLVSQRHESAPADQLWQLMRRLYELDFLVSDLMPPSLSLDPCRYAAERIPGGRATGHIVDQLRDVSDTLQHLERASHHGLTPADLLDVGRKQRALAPGHEGPAAHVDAALDLVGQGLNRAVAHAVADAVTAVASLTADTAYPHLRAYAAEFTERYGAGAEIPLLEILDPHWGIDAPPTYLLPARISPLPGHDPAAALQWREHLLMSWIQDAVVENQPLVLSDERIAQLAGDGVARQPCPLVEAYVHLHAASREAVDRGDWLAVMGPMGIVPGARSFGRFWRLLGPDAVAELQRYVAREQEIDAGPVYAELSYRPTEAGMANLTSHPQLRHYEIPVNVAPTVEPAMVLPLTDLLVGVHKGDFYIKSRRLAREVVVRQSHMLNAMRAPNECRFLLEVSSQRAGVVPAFRHKLFDRLPYCPRIVRGKVVLLPACWNITPATLGASQDGDGSFAAAVLRWRARMRVPRYVYLSAHDQRLLLDLDDATCLAQLEQAIGRLDQDPRSVLHYQKLQEVLPGFDGLWLDDGQGKSYFSELVIPVALTSGSTGPRPAIPAGRPKASALPQAGDRQVAPGGRWTYLRLQAAPDRHNKLVAAFSQFADDLESTGVADSWFFIRYADPFPHLRVRVHSSAPGTQAAVLLRSVEWAGHQVGAHAVREFSVDTYKPEIERYGGAQGAFLAEQIFHGDSRGAAAVISGICTGSVNCDPLLATAFTLDRLLSALGLEDSEKVQLGCLKQSSFPSTAGYRERRVRLIALLRSVRGGRGEAEAESLADLYGRGTARCAKAATAAAVLETDGELLRPWWTVIDSLAHMHVNRMLGINRPREAEVYALLRGALRSVLSFTPARC